MPPRRTLKRIQLARFRVEMARGKTFTMMNVMLPGGGWHLP